MTWGAGGMPFWGGAIGAVPPFMVMQEILGGDIKFDGPAWEGVSADAIDFVDRLLDRDFNNRMTAEEVEATSEHCCMLAAVILRSCTQYPKPYCCSVGIESAAVVLQVKQICRQTALQIVLHYLHIARQANLNQHHRRYWSYILSLFDGHSSSFEHNGTLCM